MFNLKVVKHSIFLFGFAVLVQVSACTDITGVTSDQIDKITGDVDILLVINHQVVRDSLIDRIRLQYVDSISVTKDKVSINRYDSRDFDRLVEIFGDPKILIDFKPDTTDDASLPIK